MAGIFCFGFYLREIETSQANSGLACFFLAKPLFLLIILSLQAKDWIFPHDPQIWSRQKSKKEV